MKARWWQWNACHKTEQEEELRNKHEGLLPLVL